MTVFGKGRVIGNRIRQIEPTEPSVCEIEMDLITEPALRADAHAIADDQHSDHQFRINRRTPRRAVERSEKATDIREIDEPIDAPQQMIVRDMILDRELVKQRALRLLPRSHHRHHPPAPAED